MEVVTLPQRPKTADCAFSTPENDTFLRTLSRSGLNPDGSRRRQATHGAPVVPGRVHTAPNRGGEAIRCDVLASGSRLMTALTVGPEAQVPLAFRDPQTYAEHPAEVRERVGQFPWHVHQYLHAAPEPLHPTSEYKLDIASRPATAPVVTSHHTRPSTSVWPVRGSVVLSSLRTQPQPPPNGVRTRGKAELVYSGPSHLLREQFEALKASERREKEKTRRQARANKHHHSNSDDAAPSSRSPAPPAAAAKVPSSSSQAAGRRMRGGEGNNSSEHHHQQRRPGTAPTLTGVSSSDLHVWGGASSSSASSSASPSSSSSASSSVASLRFDSLFGHPHINTLHEMEGAYGLEGGLVTPIMTMAPQPYPGPTRAFGSTTGPNTSRGKVRIPKKKKESPPRFPIR